MWTPGGVPGGPGVKCPLPPPAASLRFPPGNTMALPPPPPFSSPTPLLALLHPPNPPPPGAPPPRASARPWTAAASRRTRLQDGRHTAAAASSGKQRQGGTQAEGAGVCVCAEGWGAAAGREQGAGQADDTARESTQLHTLKAARPARQARHAPPPRATHAPTSHTAVSVSAGVTVSKLACSAR